MKIIEEVVQVHVNFDLPIDEENSDEEKPKSFLIKRKFFEFKPCDNEDIRKIKERNTK